MYDVFLRQYMHVCMFLVTLTYQTRQTRQTHANSYTYPPKHVPLARGKGLEGRGRGTVEIPQGYPRQSLATTVAAIEER